MVEKAAGPAARAGIQRGDVVIAVNGKPVKSVEELRKAAEHGKGQRGAPRASAARTASSCRSRLVNQGNQRALPAVAIGLHQIPEAGDRQRPSPRIQWVSPRAIRPPSLGHGSFP